MPSEITDRPDAAGGVSLGSADDGNSQRAGQQALKPFPAGPIGIVGRDGSRCPLRLHEPLKVARRPRPGDGGGRPPAA